ncbi:transposase, ISL3 family [Bathymodiolus platifrons methanotrophic gill symbiont]|uniref:ISL3 family transposase n=1 Tax=Bathymodiolus platifrons methanotrophic gill symbiont TaxID=113268 RepID=UPI001B6F22C0|nr:ISL3 family transposase [Bathymodiolus platifrons methanotrophic gill symbiont]GFO74610.1 transposase, ISL3 family [Bathymodiolus platifrons methanotrophic gill symbiont]
MNNESLFSMALGLQSPWKVEEIIFSNDNILEQNELHLQIGFESGARFADESGVLCPVHDTVDRQWQHLSFFEHSCYLHCSVPRITTTDGKVRTVEVPWARPGSGFTLLFEAMAWALIEREMPVNRVAEMLKVNPHRIWTIFNHWIGKAKIADDVSSITQLGIDETSSKKGHKYVTLGVDLDESRVIFVTEGKGKATLHNLQEHLENKGVEKEQIEQISRDLSPSFIDGAAEAFPSAEITFDRFHVVKLINEAMNQVRISERKEHDALKGHKYTFLRNRENLTNKQEVSLAEMIDLYPTLGQAYRLKELFNDLWSMPDKVSAEAFLKQWCEEVEKSKISAFMKFLKTVRSHWSGIIHFVETKITNGILEGINSKVQLAKRRARGYRNINNFINMIYFLCGKLKFDYPLYFT